jgi:hypothetical protein
VKKDGKSDRTAEKPEANNNIKSVDLIYIKTGVGIWEQRDAESENLAGFAVTGTYDQSTNLLGIQKYQVKS